MAFCFLAETTLANEHYDEYLLLPPHPLAKAKNMTVKITIIIAQEPESHKNLY